MHQVHRRLRLRLYLPLLQGKSIFTLLLIAVFDRARSSEELPPCTKPLPQLPNCWTRFCDQVGLFLRSIRLGIIVTGFQGLFKRSFAEPPKAAISNDRLSASLRSIVHIIPITVALLEITVNIRGRYVGNTFDQQVYLQFAAKAHEIVIEASLATALLSYLRYEVALDKGLPFGALLGSVQFQDVSYLWSREFWSAVLSSQFRKKTKLGFISMVLVCTLIAAAAGPSSASLLIPRQDFWALESYDVFFNSTAARFWPDTLSAEDVPASCGTVTSNISLVEQCLVKDWIPQLKSSAPIFPQNIDTDVGTIIFPNTELNYGKIVVSGLCSSAWKDQYCATSAQEVFLPSMTNPPPIGAYGTRENEPTSYLDNYQIVQDNYFQPYTIASCVNTEENDALNQTPLQFPRLLQSSSELQPNRSRDIIPIPNMTVQEALGIPRDISQYQMAWVDLPQDVFGTQVPGVVFIHPQTQMNRTVDVTTCTLNAGWGSSKLMSHIESSSWVYSRRAENPTGWPPETTDYIDVANVVQQGYPDFANLSGSPYPEKRIQISREWASFLNPMLQGQNTTFLDGLLVELGDQPSEIYFARLTSMLLASALARTGIATEFNGTC